MKTIIERAMQDDKTLEIKLEIMRGEEGLYTVSINGDDAGLSMIPPQNVDDLTVEEILRFLYDKDYGAENPRFDTSHDFEAIIV